MVHFNLFTCVPFWSRDEDDNDEEEEEEGGEGGGERGGLGGEEEEDDVQGGEGEEGEEEEEEDKVEEGTAHAGKGAKGGAVKAKHVLSKLSFFGKSMKGGGAGGDKSREGLGGVVSRSLGKGGLIKAGVVTSIWANGGNTSGSALTYVYIYTYIYKYIYIYIYIYIIYI